MSEPANAADTDAPRRYGIDAETREAIDSALEARDGDALDAALAPLHAADIADLLEQIDGDDREAVVVLAPERIEGEVLSDLDEDLREEVIAALPAPMLGEAVRELDSDDIVDLIEDLEAPQQTAILNALEAADRAAARQALSYPEYSAGRLMQREVVAAPQHWTVGETIDFMRANQDSLPEQFYHVILVDPRMKPVATVTLGRLLAARRETRLSDITEEVLHSIPVTQPEDEVAYAFNHYHLISAPVVDEDGRLVGVVTIDDAMAVLDEEHEEDILRLGGVGETNLFDPVLRVVQGRFAWLLVNLVTAILASVVIANFEDAITQIVALAVLMPIVASMGGNAGTQTLTVVVRAMATRDLTPANVWRVVRRELLVGIVNGLGFAAIMAGVAALWFGRPMIGVVIALAMVLTLVAAALGGIMIPLVLERMKVDPALASGPFVSTITDVVGFFTFLGIATLVLL